MKRQELTTEQVNAVVQQHRDCLLNIEGNVILKEHNSTKGKLTAHIVEVYNKNNKEWLTGAMVVNCFWETTKGVHKKHYPMTVVSTAIKGTLSKIDLDRLWQQLFVEMAVLDFTTGD